MKRLKSKHAFVVYYFNNIMEITSDGVFDWSPQDRYKEMIGLIDEYKQAFRLHNYTNVQIWKRISKFYWKEWDVLHWESSEREKQNKWDDLFKTVKVEQ